MALLDRTQTQALAPARRSAAQRRRALVPWLFVAPALVLNLIVMAGPSLSSAYFSFTSWNGLGTPTWVGLDNFRQIAADQKVLTAIVNNVKWMALFLTVPILMALVASSLLASTRRGQLLYRTIYFIPVVIATVVSAHVWMGIYSPLFGISNVLNSWGLHWANQDWLGQSTTALYSVAFVDNWHWWGFLVVVFLSAMHQVDPALYEAARVDGANRLRLFWHVTLPSIRPTLTFIVLMTIIWSFLAFDFVFIMTQGGPGYATQLLAIRVWQAAFTEFDAGYASAIALCLSAICIAVIAGYWVLRRRVEEIA